MLHKIISVKNTGRIRNLAAQGPQFGKLVVIFGDNGSGKSTLAAVLRAASAGDPQQISARKTLGATGLQTVALLTSAGNITFDGAAWSGRYPKLQVFDREFVHQNVYLGRDIGPDQRGKLYELAIGSAAVAAKAQQEAAIAEVRAASKKVKEIEERLAARVTYLGLGLAALESAAPLAVAPAELERDKARLAQRRAGKGLAEVAGFTAVPEYKPVNFTTLRALLNQSVEALAEDAAAAVRSHIAAHLGDSGEQWLAAGVRYAEHGDECPYCGQALAGSKVAALFPKFFDAAYSELLGSIDKGLARLGDLQAWAGKFRAVERANGLAASEWAKYAALPAQPSVERLGDDVVALATTLAGLLEEKKASPLKPLGTDPRVDEQEPRSAPFVATVTSYGSWVATCQQKAQAERANESATTAKLAEAIRNAELALLRGKPDVAQDLDDLKTWRKQKTDAEAKVAAAEAALNQSAGQQSAKFAGAINTLLESFGATFRVTGLTGKPTGARITADYVLALEAGGTVKASATGGRGPSFDTVLSEGDRTTLALAVFAAMMSERPDRAECVVVLDDPFISLDRNRRGRTCELVQQLHDQTAQVIVLSHDEYFLRDVLKCVTSAVGPVQHKLDPTGRAGTLLDWDADVACRERYFADLDKLQTFVDTGENGSSENGSVSLGEAWSLVRPLLEEYLRFRFPLYWKPKQCLGGFLALAKDVKSAPHPLPLTAVQIAQIESFKSRSNDPHHGGGPQPVIPPSETEMIALANEVLAFVRQS